MKNILIIDSYSLANRSYYALKNKMTDRNGNDTRVLYGYLTTMLKYVEEYNIDSVVAAFDPRGKSFRSEICEEYKGTRIKMDDTIHLQIGILKELLPIMGCEVVECMGYEADDVIGTISKKESVNNKVYILSGDRDLFALINENCKQIYTSTSKGVSLVDCNGVKNYFGVTPELLATYKALVGDKSDNISGVKSIGEKTALRLIEEFGNLENILTNIDSSVETDKVKNAIKNGTEDARRSHQLAKIACDIEPLDYHLYEFMKNIDDKKLYEQLDEYSLSKVISKLKIEVKADNNKKILPENIDIESFKKIVDRHNMPYDVAFTLSATNLYVCFDKESTIYSLKSDIAEALDYLNEGANRLLTYDMESFLPYLHLKRDGRDYFDTKIAAYVIDSSQRLESEELIKKYTEYDAEVTDYSNAKDEKGKKLKKEKIEELLAEERTYLGAFLAANCSDRLESIIREEDLYELFYEIEMPLVFVLYDMRKVGIGVDRNNLENYGKEIEKRISIVEKSIHALADEEFNINSPKELGRILFEKLALPKGKKTKTGWSTSIDVLEALYNDSEIIKYILEYRKLTKLNSTYIQGLADVIQEDGRIHTKFKQTVTQTGRLSSVEPNLQNLPIKTELGRDLRKAFIPKAGYKFVDADYSQVELRILAHLAQDENMLKAFEDNCDIHSTTAAKIFNIPLEEVTSEQRRSAKAINFGIVYGMGAYSLSQDLGISLDEANLYINNYFKHYSKVKQYLDSQVSMAEDIGYVSTIYNRRRYINDIKSNVKPIKAAATRIAMNSPIQGSAADIMKIAMNNVYHKINHDKIDAKIILQIHDELLVEVKEEQAEKFAEVLKEVMENSVNLSVKLSVNVQCGNSMYELK